MPCAVWGAHPECTGQGIRNILALTAKHPTEKCNQEFGFGVVQPCKAIEHIETYGCVRTEGNWILSNDDRVCSNADTFTFRGEAKTPGAGHHPGGSGPVGKTPDDISQALIGQINQLQKEYSDLKNEVENGGKSSRCRDHPRRKVRLPKALRKGRKRKATCEWAAKKAAETYADVAQRDGILKRWCESKFIAKTCKMTCRKCPSIN